MLAGKADRLVAGQKIGPLANLHPAQPVLPGNLNFKLREAKPWALHHDSRRFSLRQRQHFAFGVIACARLRSEMFDRDRSDNATAL